MLRKSLTEFIGTFFLVLVVLLAAVGGHAGAAAPVAIGLILMVMVYMGGHISGAHYNPAVTLAVLLRGKILPDAAVYWITQFVAAFVAAFVAYLIDGKTGFAAPAAAATTVDTYLVEILFTFALALVVLNVATAKGTANNSFYGAAIGLTVCAAAFTVGNISGGAFNPAVGVSPILFDLVKGTGKAASSIPLYIVGPCVGGVLAAIVFRIQNPGE